MNDIGIEEIGQSLRDFINNNFHYCKALNLIIFPCMFVISTYIYSTSLGLSSLEIPTKTHNPFPIELTISLLTEKEMIVLFTTQRTIYR